MPLNVDKCYALHFLPKNNPNILYNVNGVTLPSTNVIKDLGLYVDSHLKFRSHMDHVNTKCYRTINLIFKNFSLRDSHVYCTLYKVYVLPIVLYGLPLYSNGSNTFISEIEKIQRYFTRRLFMRIKPNETRLSYTERMKLFNLQSLEFLIIKTDLCTLFKLINNLFPSSFEFQFSTRSPMRFIFCQCSSRLFRNSFFHRALVSWNKLIASKIPSLAIDLPCFQKLIDSLPLSSPGSTSEA